MLATVLVSPLGAAGGQLTGWRGPFWVLALVAAAAVARTVPTDSSQQATPSIRTELRGLRSTRCG